MDCRPTIDQFCEKYRNENGHTEFVTSLAGRIFDAVREDLGLPLRDRPLLEAAARLHDIAYSVNVPGHAAAGAELVVRNGLFDFNSSQSRCIAAIMLLHGGEYRRLQRHPILGGLTAPNRKRAIRLGAILRVADGLDHGHIQDARIVKIQRRGQVFRMTVCSEGYTGNIPWAEKKADLWRETYPVGLELREKLPGKGKQRFPGIAHARSSVLEAARKLLASHYRAMMDPRAGALEGEDPECLHALRVGMRRFRAVLRVFLRHLEAGSASRLNRALSALAAELSPIRDSDVWVEFLQRKEVARVMKGEPDWRAYVEQQHRARAEQLERLREILRSRKYATTMQQVAHFTRVEMSDLARANRRESLRPFAARRLRRTFRRISHHAPLRKSASADAMHELRRLCRRERYWAEFFAPALGSFTDELVSRIKAIVDTLGGLHDMDVALERIDSAGLGCGDALARLLRKKRRRYWQEFEEAWERLHQPKFQRRMTRRLAQLEKE